MNIQKLNVKTPAVIPLMAALPYEIEVPALEEGAFTYDPQSQLTHFAGRNFSTCREDESVNPFFGTSKADTKKDD